jgi:hypothetical protein
VSDALAFLSIGDALAVSPLASGTAAAGARYETRDGWHVAARFADPVVEARAAREAVAWADVSHLRKWELQAPAAVLDALDPLPALGDGLAVRDAEGAWWCRATPERALVLGRTAAPAAGSSVHVLDVTSQLGALRIAVRVPARLGRAHAGLRRVRGAGPLPAAVRRRLRRVRVGGRERRRDAPRRPAGRRRCVRLRGGVGACVTCSASAACGADDPS